MDVKRVTALVASNRDLEPGFMWRDQHGRYYEPRDGN